MIERKALALAGSKVLPGRPRLTDVHPSVRGGRVADGEAPPRLWSPLVTLIPFLPGHTQLLDGPVETRGVSDGNCGLQEGGNNHSTRNHGGLNNGQLKIHPDTALLPYLAPADDTFCLRC